MGHECLLFAGPLRRQLFTKAGIAAFLDGAGNNGAPGWPRFHSARTAIGCRYSGSGAGRIRRRGFIAGFGGTAVRPLAAAVLIRIFTRQEYINGNYIKT